MKQLRKIFIITISALILTTAVTFLASPAKFWMRMVGNPDLGPVDFTTLAKSPDPNQYLLCPINICKLETPDDEPKTYPFNAQILKQKFLDVISDKNTEMIKQDEHTVRFIARSSILQFPDTVSVEFFDIEKGSTMAIYSRSQIGYSDFGTNESRVRRWLEKLDNS